MVFSRLRRYVVGIFVCAIVLAATLYAISRRGPDWLSALAGMAAGAVILAYGAMLLLAPRFSVNLVRSIAAVLDPGRELTFWDGLRPERKAIIFGFALLSFFAGGVVVIASVVALLASSPQ
jgi:hypothetical protein